MSSVSTKRDEPMGFFMPLPSGNVQAAGGANPLLLLEKRCAWPFADANPGELLTTDTTPMTREQAQVLAIDLSRRSTPAEGGFCTFQPVVDGGACPWNLNCHNCDKFVLSGADLLYWRRKREQWRQLAEGAPDDATADYLHRYFEPTARAIDGLEKALAGLELLDQALALDLRKPQDYFRRVWSTAFRATDLADTASTAHDHNSENNDQEACA